MPAPLYLPYELSAVPFLGPGGSDDADPFGIDAEQTVSMTIDADPFAIDPEQTTVVVVDSDPFGAAPGETNRMNMGPGTGPRAKAGSCNKKENVRGGSKNHVHCS